MVSRTQAEKQEIIDRIKFMKDAPFDLADYEVGIDQDFIENWLLNQFHPLFAGLSLVAPEHERPDLYASLQISYAKMMRRDIYMAIQPALVKGKLRRERQNYITRSPSLSGIYVPVSGRVKLQKMLKEAKEQDMTPNEWISENTEPGSKEFWAWKELYKANMIMDSYDSLVQDLDNSDVDIENYGKVLWDDE